MAAPDANNSELDDIKKQVRSLLLTYPKGVNVKSFINTFREVCCDLPFQKYGFRSADGMLYAFTDVLNARHSPEGILLVAIPNEKSDHVQTLVSHQKPSMNRPRRSPFRPSYNKDNKMALKRETNLRAPRNEFKTLNFHSRFYHPFPPYPGLPFQLSHGPPPRQHSQPLFQPGQPFIQQPSPVGGLMFNGAYNFQPQWPTFRVLPQRPPPGFFGPPAHQNQYFSVGGGEGRKGSIPFGGGHPPVPFQPPPIGLEEKKRAPSPTSLSAERPVKLDEKAATTPCQSPEEQACDKQDGRKSNSPDHSDLDSNFDDGSTENSTRRRRKSSFGGISDRMVHNFRVLLSEHPEGVTSSQFARLYMSKFNVPLDFEDYGFSSVREMVLRLPEVFVFEKTKMAKDWTLYDARISPKKRVVKETWVPSDILDKLSVLTQDHPQGIKADKIIEIFVDRFKIPLDIKLLGFKDTLAFLNSCKSVTVQEVDGSHIVLPKVWGRTFRESQTPRAPALPPDDQMADLWSSFFKEEECGPFFEYSQPTVPKERVLKVFLCDAYSPELLWLHDASKLTALHKMMDELNNYYDENESNLIYPEEAVQVNFPCVVKFVKDYSWYRAKIEKILSEQQVKVRYVDYGTVAIVGVNELRKLLKKFTLDPIYAYTCKIAGIEPIGNEWPAETANFLFEYCTHPIFAEFIDPSEVENGILSVNLVDTMKKEEDISIADVLIAYKLAKPIKPRELARFDEVILEATMMMLPFWITESDDCTDYQKDLVFTAQNLLASSDPNFIEKPLNLEVDPCCNEHDLRTFFQSSPKSTIQLWATVLTKYRDQMTADFLRMACELSNTDWRSRQYIHGIRCPARHNRATQARERMVNVRKDSGIHDSVSFRDDGEPPSAIGLKEDPSQLSIGGLTSLPSLAKSSELNHHLPAVPFDPPAAAPFANSTPVPESTEDWLPFRVNHGPFETHTLRASMPSLPPPNQLPSYSRVTLPHLCSIPPIAVNPQMLNPLLVETHPIHTSLSHVSHTPLSPRLPPITMADTAAPPHSLPSPRINGYFHQLDNEPISQNAYPLPRPRTGSMTSQMSQRRCKCTTSIQTIDLADQIVHVIQHGDGLFLSCDELLKNYAGNLSKTIAHERFNSGQKYFKFAAINVHAVDHQKLFAELDKFGLLENKNETILFSVREVGNFFRTLLPHEPVLAVLADEKFQH